MTLSYHQLVAALRVTVPEVSVDELGRRLDDLPVLIDVRETDEVLSGFISGAIHVPRGVLEGAIAGIVPDLQAEIVLYCSQGNRSVLAAASLQAMGFSNVWSLAGGTFAWRMAGNPITVPGATRNAPDEPDLPSSEDAARYARHMTLPGVGVEGQRKLGSAAALIVGAGGLGSPVALYLAAAGVGRIGIVDPDVVDVTNLQRQIVHDTASIGMAKTESAASTLRKLNPSIVVEPHTTALVAANAIGLLAGYDVVIDATDNFPTRYLLNDASLHTRTPVIHGSVFRYEGQVSVFDPYRGPCYRCLFPVPPPPELAPNCAEAGVLGSVTGTVGTIQATEVLKMILGIGEPLIGRLLVIDVLTQESTLLQIARDPQCPTCSDEASPPRLVDYDDACRALPRN